MQSTGIVRKVDELGRIVLPVEIRAKMDIGAKDGVEFYWQETYLLLKKHEPACAFCGSADNIVAFQGKNICKVCREQIGKIKEK